MVCYWIGYNLLIFAIIHVHQTFIDLYVVVKLCLPWTVTKRWLFLCVHMILNKVVPLLNNARVVVWLMRLERSRIHVSLKSSVVPLFISTFALHHQWVLCHQWYLYPKQSFSKNECWSSKKSLSKPFIVRQHLVSVHGGEQKHIFWQFK